MPRLAVPFAPEPFTMGMCLLLFGLIGTLPAQEGTARVLPPSPAGKADSLPDLLPDWNPQQPSWLSIPQRQPGGQSGAGASWVDVPEPLLFDLVRPLGAKQGELEFNTLALFPWRRSNKNPDDDPFGSGPTTPDRGGIEWAPEVEYAIVDGFAVEFEFPFEDATLEEYKLGLQWTIGTPFEGHYIHGVQMLVEPDTHFRHWNSTLLYIGGIRFDDTWSSLFMIGGRIDLEGPRNFQTFERLANISLFAHLTHSTTLGLETNTAVKTDGTCEFIAVPQLHHEFTEHFEVQTGLGFGVFSEGSEQSFILRVIYSH